MTSIYNLSSIDEVSTSDQIPVQVLQSGDMRKMSVALLAAFIQESLSVSGYLQTQYAAPAASGFNVAVTPVTPGGSVHLLLTPLAGFGAGTITLPTAANTADGQEVLCNSTQLVTALSVVAPGATVNGAPTTLAGSGFFRMRYNGIMNTWYRVG